MQFVIEDREYGVAEFLDKFVEALPQIVTVSQGYCGDIIEDTFCKDQILRLHTVSRQKRVVARTTVSGESKVLSIPLTYKDMKLCVTERNGRVGKEKSISDIIKGVPKLPVHVKFPPNKSITVGDHSISTRFLPELELTQVFDEVYILGNTVDHISGTLLSEVIPVPLYLPQLRLSLVTGVDEYYFQDGWDKLLITLSISASKLKFRNDFGNPEIAEYKPVATTESNQDDTYMYITPQCYVNVIDVFSGRSTFKTHQASSNQVNARSSRLYEEFEKQREDQQSVHERNAPYSEKFTSLQSLKNEMKPQASCLYETFENTFQQNKPADKATVKSSPSREKPHPLVANNQQQEKDRNSTLYEEIQQTVKHRASQNPAPLTTVRSQAPAKFPPALPPRGVTKSQTNEASVKTIIYENDVPRGKVTPIRKQTSTPEITYDGTGNQPRKPVKLDSPKSDYPLKNDIPITIESNVNQSGTCLLKQINGRDDIKKLSMDDVSEYLKVLGLENYVQAFRDDRVDGALLVEVDRNILKEDFGMRTVEAMRLMMFIEKGHMPQ